MKKIYEVPAMEIVRLDASENIAKLPTVGETSNASVNSNNQVETRTKSTGLLAAIAGFTGSNVEEA